MTINQQRVVILGGTSGIGLAVAEAVKQAGNLPVVISSNQTRIDKALAQLGENAEGIAADVRDGAAMKTLFEHIGSFDHLVFTAGENLKFGLVREMPMDEARAFFDIRFWGAFSAVKYGAKFIRPGGSITFSSGIAAMRPPQAGWALGASVCAAIEGLTRSLAIELKPLRVNCVSPGFVRTPLWDNIPQTEREAMYEAAGDQLPVGRVGLPDDLAKAYLFLMHQTFATGQIFVVDGGGMIA